MKKKQSTWVYVALLGLVLFLIAWLILAVYSAKITLTTPVYFFLLVIAALSATAFLSGALNSSAQYSGDVYKGKLKLSGPIVVFLLIMIAGYKFRPLPRTDPFDLTIYVYGEGGRSEPVHNGIIRIQEGNETKSGSLDSNGRALINNVNPDYLGKKILITSAVEDYHISSGDTEIQIPQKSIPVIFLPMVRNHDSLLVRGNVVKKDQSVLKGAVLEFTSFSRATMTDQDGNFNIYLPVKKGENTALIIKSKDVIIFNSNIIISEFQNIRLDE